MDENFNEIIRFTALLRALENLNVLPETEAQELKQVRKALEDYISFIRNNGQVPQQEDFYRVLKEKFEKISMLYNDGQKEYLGIPIHPVYKNTCPICKGSRVATIKNEVTDIVERIVCFGCNGLGYVVGGKK